MSFIRIRFLWRALRNQCKCRYRPYDPYNENERAWVKDMSCMYHWIQTQWYHDKFKALPMKDEVNE